MSTPTPLFDISPDEINRVVAKFYNLSRKHPVLGPLFSSRIPQDAWPAHIEKVKGFWRKAILREDSYSGNPMHVHINSDGLTPAPFVQWLELFDESLSQELPPELAKQWSNLAHRVARGISTGLNKSSPPLFSARS